MSWSCRFWLLPMLAIAFQGAAIGTFAQAESSIPGEKPKANTVSLVGSMHHFFDWTGVVHPVTKEQPWWTNVAWGIEYCRRLRLGWGLQASLKYYRAAYHYGTTLLSEGEVFERDVFFLEVDCRRWLFLFHQTKLSGLIGLNFRLGEEPIVIGYGAFDVLLDDYPLRDLGVSAGIRVEQGLFRHFALAGEFKFTQYLWRYENGRNHQDQFPNRSTRNMLTLQMGLGYWF